MTTKLSTDLQCDFPFLKYRRHNIPKIKLHGEFVQKDRSSFPTGFIEKSTKTNDQKTNFSCDKGGKEHISKLDLEILRRQLLQDGYRAKKRKAPLHLENAKIEMLQHKEKSFCTNENHTQSSNGSQMNQCRLMDVPMKHTNSVFLEVQNIRNSFQRDKPIVHPSFKSPSRLPFVRGDGFKPGLKKGEEVENVPKRGMMGHSTFVIPHEVVFPSPKAVQKVNASVLSHFATLSQDSFCSLSSTELATACLALTSKKIESHNKVVSIKTSSFQSLENTFENDKIRKKIISENISAPIEAEGSKGSHWVHSLPQALAAETEDENSAKKRKIRNILPGGLAERMLKLQRREKSEKVIWKHKADQNKKKALTNSLCLVITAISHMSDIVAVKCVSDSSSDVSGDLEGASNLSALLSNRSGPLDGRVSEENHPISRSKYVIVLFRKSSFTKLHLNLKDTFLLYQPWQTLHLRSIPYPVVLCAYFVEHVAQTRLIIEKEALADNEPIEESDFPTASVDLVRHGERICSEDDLFWRGSVTVSARVQRIWSTEISSEDFSIFKGAIKHFMYSVLLQTEVGSFHELLLRFCSESIPNSWLKFLSGAEGRCYIFRNLHPSHRLHFKRHKDFFRILNSFSQYQKGQSGKELKEKFCYQLLLGSKSEIPQEISEDPFPAFYPIVVQPLLQLLKGGVVIRRVSCLGKLLLKYDGSFYISDESLCHSGSLRYIRVQSLSFSVGETGTALLIKEALFQEGCLLLDRYSQLQQLHISSEECGRLGLSSRIVQLSLVQLQNVIPPLTPTSQVTQLVSIKGDVTGVDESKAFTWLQCSFCLQENLIQDTNLVIYCEDCSQVVPKPVLNVKMEVTICCETMPSAVVNIQLLSATIRHILQIDDNTYQPQCTVADVLGETIGPLFCYVRNCEIIRDQHFFHLSEVQSN